IPRFDDDALVPLLEHLALVGLGISLGPVLRALAVRSPAGVPPAGSPPSCPARAVARRAALALGVVGIRMPASAGETFNRHICASYGPAGSCPQADPYGLEVSCS